MLYNIHFLNEPNFKELYIKFYYCRPRVAYELIKGCHNTVIILAYKYILQ